MLTIYNILAIYYWPGLLLYEIGDLLLAGISLKRKKRFVYAADPVLFKFDIRSHQYIYFHQIISSDEGNNDLLGSFKILIY